MTPPARYAAAIDLLGQVMDGAAVEKSLTTWGRKNRYAGSGDRRAIRDIVFDCLRRLRSLGWCSGVAGARGVVMGYILEQGHNPGEVFTGLGYAPAVLTEQENAAIASPRDPATPAVALDIPDWLEPQLRQSLGEDFSSELTLMQQRAPVDLRVNLKKSDLASAQALLARDGIETEPHELADTALRVVGATRKLPRSTAYLQGEIELQDAASQAVVAMLPVQRAGRILDYCAGGGGKALAMAAIAPPTSVITAYDASAARMKDLTQRTARAGVSVRLAEDDPANNTEKFDFILLDVPCSGTGAWRRNPDQKWKLTPTALDDLKATQAEILDRAVGMLAAEGQLAYVTCSVLQEENNDQITAFLARHNGFIQGPTRHFLPEHGGDGFFVSLLTRRSEQQ